MTSSTTISTTSTVAGLWERLIEEDPIGDTANADRDTTVLWTQSSESGIYVDLRLPKTSPGLSVEAAQAGNIVPRPSALTGTLSSSNTDNTEALLPHLPVLLQQKGFAGVLTITAGDTKSNGRATAADATLQRLANDAKALIPLCTCFWRRDVDYQPPTGDLDIGICASASSLDATQHLLLRETGADASYAEDWSRPQSTAKGPFMALELVDNDDSNDNGRKGYWVRAGDCFAYAVGRPTKGGGGIHTCVGKSLAEATQMLAPNNGVDDKERLALLVSYVSVAGRIHTAEAGKEEWRIECALNPELVGCILVAPAAGQTTNWDLLCCRLEKVNDMNRASEYVEQVMVDDQGQEVRRTWKVVELTDCSLPM